MSAAVGGTGPHIVHVELGLPGAWWSWPVDTRLGTVPEDAARELADAPGSRAQVRRSVLAVHADAVARGNLVGSVGIWVPDRSTGEVMAILDVTSGGLVEGVASPEAYLARDVHDDLGGWRTKILDRATSLTEVPAGPAAIEQLLLRRRGEREVQGYLLFLLHPRGGAEPLRLAFNTVHLNLLSVIAEHARMIAESVVVTLGTAPGDRAGVRVR